MYRKSMREALQEARAYRDPLQEDKGFSSQQIKMAYGVLNDPRYKQGNYSGAVKAIEKIAKGLSNHPDVANALKRANEELEEAKTVGGALAQGHLETMTDQRFKEFYGMTKDEYIKKHGDPRKEELDEALEVKWDSNKQGWFDKQGRRRYLGKMATNKLMSKAIDKAKETGDFINPFKLKHGQKPEETDLKEGYEGNILHMLRQKGIKGRFSNRKLYLKKGEDENAARLFLKLKVKDRDDKDNIIYGHEVPEIIGEETELEEARYRVDGQLSYKGIGSYDGFEVVVNARNESDAEDKAYDALNKARDKRKIGPGGGGSIDDVEFEGIEKTNDRLSDPETFRGGT